MRLAGAARWPCSGRRLRRACVRTRPSGRPGPPRPRRSRPRRWLRGVHRERSPRRHASAPRRTSPVPRLRLGEAQGATPTDMQFGRVPATPHPGGAEPPASVSAPVLPPARRAPTAGGTGGSRRCPLRRQEVRDVGGVHRRRTMRPGSRARCSRSSARPRPLCCGGGRVPTGRGGQADPEAPARTSTRSASPARRSRCEGSAQRAAKPSAGARPPGSRATPTGMGSRTLCRNACQLWSARLRRAVGLSLTYLGTRFSRAFPTGRPIPGGATGQRQCHSPPTGTHCRWRRCPCAGRNCEVCAACIGGERCGRGSGSRLSAPMSLWAASVDACRRVAVARPTRRARAACGEAGGRSKATWRPCDGGRAWGSRTLCRNACHLWSAPLRRAVRLDASAPGASSGALPPCSARGACTCSSQGRGSDDGRGDVAHPRPSELRRRPRTDGRGAQARGGQATRAGGGSRTLCRDACHLWSVSPGSGVRRFSGARRRRGEPWQGT